MRTPRPLARLALSALASLSALAAAPARADQPAPVELTVGESKPLGGSAARCDDLGVVSVTLGPQAVVTGLKPGKTLCSVAAGGASGARRVFQVTVLAAKSEAPGKRAAKPEARPAPGSEPGDGLRRPDGG
jgi:hypothetical protein